LEEAMIDTLTTLQNLNKVRKWVEGDGFAAAFADLSLQTAKEAVARVRDAKDKKAQVWSIINHLEQAKTALRIQLESHVIHIVQAAKCAEMEEQYKYIRHLMKICYIYVEEPKLAENIMSADTDLVYKEYPSEIEVLSLVPTLAFMFANPITYYYWAKAIRNPDRYDISKLPQLD
jgi:hypothetical protein